MNILNTASFMHKIIMRLLLQQSPPFFNLSSWIKILTAVLICYLLSPPATLAAIKIISLETMYVAPVIRIHSLHLTKHKKKEAFFFAITVRYLDHETVLFLFQWQRLWHLLVWLLIHILRLFMKLITTAKLGNVT